MEAMTCPECGHDGKPAPDPVAWLLRLLGRYPTVRCGASDSGGNPSGWPEVCECTNLTHRAYART